MEVACPGFRKYLAPGIALSSMLLFFLPWRFQVNDDVIMMWLVSGAYTGSPEHYVVFIHPVLSFLLSKVYTLLPDFNWYGLTWILTNGLSAYLIARTILDANAARKWKGFCLAFLAAVFIHLSIFVQFTLVSGFAAFAGLQVFRADPKPSRNLKILGLMAWTLAILIRWESATLIGMGWAWFSLVFGNLFSIPQIKKLGILSLIFLLLVGGKFAWESVYTDSEFRQFNTARSAVLDHPVFAEDIIKDNLPLGSDWYFFARWIFEELPIGNEELQQKKTELDSRLLQWNQVRYGLTRILRIQKTEVFKSMLISLLILIFWFTKAPQPKKILFFFTWMLFYLIFNHFNLLLGRVNFLFFLTLFFPVLKLPQHLFLNRWVNILTLMLILFLGKHSWNFYHEYQERKIVNREIAYLLSNKEPDIPIFLEGVFEFYFMEHFSYRNPVPFLTYGWISRSPFQSKAYKRFNFSKQSELNEFGLLSFSFPEPLQFPNYMSRISHDFRPKHQVDSKYFRLTYYANSLR
jgi:hypothetical protein